MRISDWSSDVCSSDLTVQGTNATSDFGPDLTHLASRRTIAAGLLPNTVGDLAGWILDPQRHKPGNALPAMQLEPDALQDLRPEEHTSELQSLMRTSYAVSCLNKTNKVICVSKQQNK